MGQWQKEYQAGCYEFTRKNWSRAGAYFIRSVNQDSTRPESWLMLSLASAKMGDLGNAIIQSRTCLDLQPDNCFAQFCADAFNQTLTNQFQLKVGVKLELFDDEVVYSTENEMRIERGTDLEPLNFEKELDQFWEGYVKGNLNIMKDRYGLSDELINRHLKHIQHVLAIGFQSIKIKPNDHILEIGSGAGKILHALARQGFLPNTVATDIAIHELCGLKKRVREVHKDEPMGYVGLLADCLPFKHSSFDVILLMDVVEHLYAQEFICLLNAARDILKSSGKLYIQTPNGLRYMCKVNRLQDGTVSIPEMNGNWQHVAEKTMGYLKKTLCECGYDIKVLNRMRCVVEATVKQNPELEI